MSSVETARYWPRRIESLRDVPSVFKDKVTGYDFASSDVLYAPASAALSSPKREHLVVLCDSSLTVHTAQRGGKEISSAPLSGVETLEWGCVLLQSWLKIWTTKGEVSVFFNTVREELFTPVAVAIRTARMETKSGPGRPNSASVR